jgi:hypothetical protein
MITHGLCLERKIIHIKDFDSILTNECKVNEIIVKRSDSKQNKNSAQIAHFTLQMHFSCIYYQTVLENRSIKSTCLMLRLEKLMHVKVLVGGVFQFFSIYQNFYKF